MKLQHIKGIANILADSVSRLKAVGLYHDLELQHNPPELSIPFEPLPPIDQAIIPNSSRQKPTKSKAETLAKHLTVAQIDSPNTPIGDISPEDKIHIEHKLMSLPKLTPPK